MHVVDSGCNDHWYGSLHVYDALEADKLKGYRSQYFPCLEFNVNVYLG